MKQVDTPLNALYKLICVIIMMYLAMLQDLEKQASCHRSFFPPQTICPVISLIHNLSGSFFRDLTVISKYLFGMIPAHCKDEFYLICQDFHEGHVCISLGKGGTCILLGHTAADLLIAKLTQAILYIFFIENYLWIWKLRVSTLLKSEGFRLWWLIFNIKCIRIF